MCQQTFQILFRFLLFIRKIDKVFEERQKAVHIVNSTIGEDIFKIVENVLQKNNLQSIMNLQFLYGKCIRICRNFKTNAA